MTNVNTDLQNDLLKQEIQSTFNKENCPMYDKLSRRELEERVCWLEYENEQLYRALKGR